ncbi:MAG: hypothetical protein WKF96_16780 [Solirubrobacteraceae bacterium]
MTTATGQSIVGAACIARLRRGLAAGAYNLGVLLQRGDLDQAQGAYRRAAASDDEAVAARARGALDKLGA